MSAGLSNFTITTAAVLWFGIVTQQLDLSWLHDRFLPLLAATAVLAFALSFCLYLASFREGPMLAKGGVSGVPVYDFFMGRHAGTLRAMSCLHFPLGRTSTQLWQAGLCPQLLAGRRLTTSSKPLHELSMMSCMQGAEPQDRRL